MEKSETISKEKGKRKKGLQSACLKWALWTDQLPYGRSENRSTTPGAPCVCRIDEWTLGVDTTSRSFQGYGLNPHKRKKTYKSSQKVKLLLFLFYYVIYMIITQCLK